jgi:ABC-type Fe3+/spermidine/putrescine transport system ATPase subunit
MRIRGQAGATAGVRWVLVDGARPLGARSSGMIEAQDLTKVYGGKAAVDHLSFTVEPGRVTGFLGPNGAGKSTTMRLILGLDRPQSGYALINGRRYRDLKDPPSPSWAC